MVIESIAADERLTRLKELLRQSTGAVHVTGLWGSSAPMVAATAASSIQRSILYVTAHLDQADDARDDIELFLGGECQLLPAWEALPGEGAASDEIDAERLRLCSTLLNCGLQSIEPSSVASRLVRGALPPASPTRGDATLARSTLQPARPSIIVAPVQALMQPVPSQAALRINTLTFRAGASLKTHAGPDQLLAWFVERGFERLDRVESPGDVAQRGDILDIFPPGDHAPVRIQFDEHTVESIRRFDVSSQRSVESVPELSISAMPENDTETDGETTHFWDYLPPDTLIVWDDAAEIQNLGDMLRRRLGDSDRLYEPSALFQTAQRFAQLFLSRFGGAAVQGEEVIDLAVTSLSRFDDAQEDPIVELLALARDHEVVVFCDNDGERQRLTEMLREKDPAGAAAIRLEIGVLHCGFVWTATRTAVVAHHEIFRRHRQRRRVRRLHAGTAIESWTDLKPGEHVVHVLHGIAVYRGLHHMRKGDSAQQEEFLTLEFADRAVIHVPTSQIELVQKYIGAGGRRPQLSTLGGKRWTNTKDKVRDSVADLAESLLKLQALRTQATGVAFHDDTQWQHEFEAAFEYEETEDQLSVAEEIRGDLCRIRPMDRLVCGDVGYGKTELAMRAAFKVVEYGKQVAVLVPTTVLAEQHYETFRERMAEFPFSIGCLSRFRTPAEQKEILARARKGQVDVVIGTHRLLSKDVAFADLGLVVIDEEQRFGVEHKERLRAMRETVDVLTLTATPIPRTLHMSLMGVRDISSLQTPPVDRRAIATQVRPFERQLIRDAILREMNRDGQVYFVHNYVQSIAAMAATVAEIVPEARVVYGHGQMDDKLEDVMHRFVRREADVLVATTIIESGIDIPSVNTIFINRADRFGLADLHQLRGRVGRSAHRAYCYLLLSPDRPVTSKAAKRLKTIEEFSELGAGFRIAMRDLEIRGAGNLLGREQSGHIAAVGYDMYCRLLDQTVRRLKNEPDPTPPAVHVDLDVAAHVPPHYVASDRSRIEVYRRIAACRTIADLTQLEKDLIDAFGPFPREVQHLLELAEIRVHARRFGIGSISLQPPDVIFKIENLPTAQPAFANAPGTVRMPDAKTVHLRLPPAYLERPTLVSILRNMLARAAAKTQGAPV